MSQVGGNLLQDILDLAQRQRQDNDIGIRDRAMLHLAVATGIPEHDGYAVAYIEANEDLDRGWYTGGIGFVTPGGDGALDSPLRCGLVQGSTTDLYATLLEMTGQPLFFPSSIRNCAISF